MGFILAEIGIELSDESLRPSFVEWLDSYVVNLTTSPVSHIDYGTIQVIPDTRFPEELKIKIPIHGNSFAQAKEDAEAFIDNLTQHVKAEFFNKHSNLGQAEIFGQTLMAA